MPDPDLVRPAANRNDSQTGRPFDHSGDALILATSLDLISERVYERVTIDEVAARTGRAKTTLYRRWPTKDDLVLAAIRSIGRPPEIDQPPDRGNLRADLLAVIDSPWLGGPDRRVLIFAGLASAARSSAALAETIRLEVTEPYVEIYRQILERAISTGDAPETLAARVPLLAELIPAMSNHRLNASGGPIPRAFFVSLIDDVLIPASKTWPDKPPDRLKSLQLPRDG
jgi:AcrR family transcriptional regulator